MLVGFDAQQGMAEMGREELNSVNWDVISNAFFQQTMGMDHIEQIFKF